MTIEKKIKGLISQSRELKPTLIVLYNDFDVEPEFNYVTDGSYNGVMNGCFPTGKSTILIGGVSWDGGVGDIRYGFDGESTFNIVCIDQNGDLANTDNLKNTLFEITVEVEAEYTPQELSEIYHACSILTRGGNEKLVELASRIGFQRPRPNQS